jgi:2-iminobutanoate/2-iminopropanoate deaminase
MSKIKMINPESLRIPSKAYSQGIIVPLGDADMMFVTGQVSQDIDGNVLFPNDAKEQAGVVYDRIETILREGGMSMDDVVKAQIFLTDIKDGPTVSKIRDEVFKNAKPVSTLVEVNALVKPECCVEIEVTAVKYRA